MQKMPSLIKRTLRMNKSSSLDCPSEGAETHPESKNSCTLTGYVVGKIEVTSNTCLTTAELYTVLKEVLFRESTVYKESLIGHCWLLLSFLISASVETRTLNSLWKDKLIHTIRGPMALWSNSSLLTPHEAKGSKRHLRCTERIKIGNVVHMVSIDLQTDVCIRPKSYDIDTAKTHMKVKTGNHMWLSKVRQDFDEYHASP